MNIENLVVDETFSIVDPIIYPIYPIEPTTEIEPNDTIAEANPTDIIPGGSSYYIASAEIGNNPNIGRRRDVDLYQVDLVDGDLLTVDIDAEFLEGGLLDSYLRLFDSSGTEIASNDDFEGLDSYLEFLAPTAGTYYIGVSDLDNSFYDPTIEGSGQRGSTGIYNISISTEGLLLDETEPNDTLELAQETTISPEGEQNFFTTGYIGNNSNIDPFSDVDLYKVSLEEGQGIQVTTSDYGDDIFYNVLRIFDASGNELGISYYYDSFDDYISNSLDFVVPTTGTYYIGVSGDDNDYYDPELEESGYGYNTGLYDLNITTSSQIIGTDEFDILEGTDLSDSINGLGGNDLIEGNGGNDFLQGEDGNDVVIGGDGDDLIEGGTGDDNLVGQLGEDTVFGGEDNDVISGGEGDDQLVGENGNDIISGGYGSDQISGGAGNDQLTGGYDSDLVNGGDGDDVIIGTDPTQSDYLGGTYPIMPPIIDPILDQEPIISSELSLPSEDESQIAVIEPDLSADLSLPAYYYYEQDTLVGGAGSDTFVLGDSDHPYYSPEYGNSNNMATIFDFSPSTDFIQLHGSAEDYSLEVEGFYSYIIYQPQDSLIASLAGGFTDLSLTDSYFVYV